VFSLAVAMAIVLTGPLLLFAPPFVSVMQARHDVAVRLETDPASVERVTAAMLADLFVGGDFSVSIEGGRPVLDANERSHMQDVGGVVRGLAVVAAAALGTALLAGRRLRWEPRRRARLMLTAAGAVGAAAVLLGAAFAFAFDTAFTVFHLIFFPGGNWQFPPGSSLIRLFPQPMWFELALVAGAAIVTGALVVMLLARRDLARTSPSA